METNRSRDGELEKLKEDLAEFEKVLKKDVPEFINYRDRYPKTLTKANLVESLLHQICENEEERVWILSMMIGLSNSIILKKFTDNIAIMKRVKDKTYELTKNKQN